MNEQKIGCVTADNLEVKNQSMTVLGEKTTRGHHQAANTEIRFITFFAAKDGEAVYNQQKQDLELTVAQFIRSLL